MQQQHEARVELFVSNTQAIKKEFKWQNAILHRLAALLFASENRTADCEAIRHNLERIKESTRLFSAFRGNSSLTLAAFLSLAPDQKTRLTDTLSVYDQMKEIKFRTSDYLVIAAHQIAAHAPKERFDAVIQRAKTFYDRMKAEHAFLTGQDDYIFAAMLALSELEPEASVIRMEELYAELRREFPIGNGLQALTQVLTLGEDSAHAGTRLLKLKDAFRQRSLRMDKGDLLPTLGVLSLLPVEQDTLVDDVSRTFDELRTRKGFGTWSVTKQELLLFSAALAAVNHVEDLRSGVLATSLSTSITTMLIAQQAAMAAAAAGAAAAAASSSSH